MPGNYYPQAIMTPVRVIRLTQGHCTIVDPEDYQGASPLPWHANKIHNVWYAVHTTAGKRTVGLHTFLTGFREVDHVNGDGLDNRRDNLRDATGRNSYNTRRHRDGASRYKGVSWYAARSKWTAQITLQGRKRHLGYFSVEEDAARAYDVAARKHHGAFGRYNFPQPGEQPALGSGQS